METTPLRRSAVVGALALLVAAAVSTVADAPLGRLSQVPALPTWSLWVAAALAVVGAIAVRRGRTRGWVLAVVSGAVLVTSGAVLPRVPHEALAVLLWVIQRFTGAESLFEMPVPWVRALVHLLVVVAGAVEVAVLVLLYRARGARCWRCGTRDGVPAQRPRWLRGVAIGAALAPLPYAILKAAWGLGATWGLTRPDVFAGVQLTTPGMGDTTMLSAIGVVVALVLGTRRPRVLRWPLLGIGVVGSLMLLPIGVIGTVQIVQLLLGAATFVDEGIAMEVFGVVYATLLVWGLLLAATTVGAWRAGRPPCRAHLVAQSS
ncbi:hypothetical protein [Intrasporangium sp.]|uniref:hypothetical protein n=1 Tax=Intrasporangium sp. TaxID=1925024 RepID=UPI00293A2F8D|nr:hypothetical protein [Intrasporangium sp.]MDV3220346.1 hypothetical protein [Intrasporangium sp.]